MYITTANLLRNDKVIILGVGMPLGLLPYIQEKIILSENGIIGMVEYGNEIDAGRHSVGVKRGGCIVDSSEMFGIIRGGRVDAGVLGCIQVDYMGNIASHSHSGYGGMMDIIYGAKKIIVMCQSWKVVGELSIPVSMSNAVDIIVTEKGAYHVDKMARAVNP